MRGVHGNRQRREHVKKMLQAIENLLEGKITQDVQSYSIEGRSLTKLSTTELLAMRDYYRREAQSLDTEKEKMRGYNLNIVKMQF